MTVHPTAIVEDGASLGADVEIGPYCVVGAGAILGAGVRLLSHVVLTGHVSLGPRTIVHAHAVLGGEGQIRGAHAPEARLEIGADNIIREGVTMSAGSRKGRGVTTVGARGYFMAASHIGHDCRVGDDVTLANGVQLGGHVEMGDGVIAGGLAALQQFARVGRYAFIGGLTGVVKDVIPYGMVTQRETDLGGLNLIGLKRRGVPRATIHAIRAAYRAIFHGSDGSLQQRARAAGEKWADTPEIQEIVQFILADSKRPIATPLHRGAGGDG